MRFYVIAGLFVAALGASAHAHPGLLHDKPHHTHEVLDNIHETPHCAYICIMNEDYEERWAPDCVSKEGKKRGACFCRSNAYQYIVDQCVSRKCNGEERKKVTGSRGPC